MKRGPEPYIVTPFDHWSQRAIVLPGSVLIFPFFEVRFLYQRVIFCCK